MPSQWVGNQEHDWIQSAIWRQNGPKMPNPVENNSFIPTLDRQGAIWLYIDEITQAYVDFAGRTKGTLLEVAAGYGHIVIKVLEAGAGKVLPMRSMRTTCYHKITDAAEYSNKLVLPIDTSRLTVTLNHRGHELEGEEERIIPAAGTSMPIWPSPNG